MEKLIRIFVNSGVSAFALIGSAHFLRMLAGLVIVKAISLYLGVEALAEFGILMNVATMATVLAGGGIAQGIVRYCAEHREEKEALKVFCREAWSYGICASVLIGIIVLLLPGISDVFTFGRVKSSDYAIIAGFQLLVFLTAYYNAIANGTGMTSSFAGFNVVAQLIVMPISWILIRKFDLTGGCIALVLVASVPGLLYPLFARWRGYVFTLVPKLTKPGFKKLGKYTLMIAASAILMPVTEIVVRSMIVGELGSRDAGFWQALVRFSGAYLGFLLVFLSSYFVPKIAKEKTADGIFRETRNITGLVAGIFLGAAVLMYLLRPLVVMILFSKEFLPITEFFPYLFAADFLKLTAYCMGFIAVAKAKVGLYLGSEVLQSVLLTTTVYFVLQNGWGLEGIFKGYIFSSATTLLVFSSVAFFLYRKSKHVVSD